jgi:S1-C subfamily serine protease
MMALGMVMATGCARPVAQAPLAAPLSDDRSVAQGPPQVTSLPDDILPGILRSSVQIAVEKAGTPFRWGSGVVIGARGRPAGTECLILTAGHTMAGLSAGDQVFALLDRHRAEPLKAPARVLAAEDNTNWDLALLAIGGETCPVAAAGQPPGLGEPIWVVGFPRGGEMTVGRGIVSQLSPRKAGGPFHFTVDASTSHGSSGAGVFEARTGRLIGIVQAFGTARVAISGNAGTPHIDIPLPGMTYVTPVNRIEEFLRSAGGEPLLVGRR